MFKKRTVLVVGAGASFEAKMPVGTELAGKIAEAAAAIRKGDRSFGTRLQELAYSLNQFTQPQERQKLSTAAAKIENGIHLAGSIDAFIDRHHNDEHVARLGKALIASEILNAEFSVQNGAHKRWRDVPTGEPRRHLVRGLCWTFVFGAPRWKSRGLSEQLNYHLLQLRSMHRALPALPFDECLCDVIWGCTPTSAEDLNYPPLRIDRPTSTGPTWLGGRAGSVWRTDGMDTN